MVKNKKYILGIYLGLKGFFNLNKQYAIYLGFVYLDYRRNWCGSAMWVCVYILDLRYCMSQDSSLISSYLSQSLLPGGLHRHAL